MNFKNRCMIGLSFRVVWWVLNRKEFEAFTAL